jgi:hypothetical protein
LNGFTKSIYTKFFNYESAKQIWDKLKNIHEGDDKVKEAKLQTFRAKFEKINMNEEENIVSYFLRFDEIVDNIKILGDEMKEHVVVKKALRSLPMIFDSSISALEQRVDLATMTMDELHGMLTPYEMRIEKYNPSTKEVTFKASKKINKKDKQNSKSYCSCNNDS